MKLPQLIFLNIFVMGGWNSWNVLAVRIFSFNNIKIGILSSTIDPETLKKSKKNINGH
jgi:hypothetical protein